MTSLTLYRPGQPMTLNIPSSWNELTRTELLIICSDMVLLESKGYEAKVNMLINLITLRAAGQKIKLPKRWQQNLSINDVAESGLDTINFLFDSIRLTNQLLPTIGIKREAFYHGPAKDFDDLRCGEFEDAQFFFSSYKDKGELKDLAMLSSILWRQFTDGKRITYKNYDAEKNVAAFLKLPGEMLLANFFWFAGCMLHLPEIFPKTFEGDGDPDPAAFTKCIHAGAGPKNGTREHIRDTLLKEFFFEIEQETIRALKSEPTT